MTLDKAKEGSTVKIKGFLDDGYIPARMSGLGIMKGAVLKIIRAAPFGGPLLVEDSICGGRVMICKGIASRVKVEIEKSEKK